MNFNNFTDLAPVALFVYNRPIQTKKVLDALSKCHESKKTILYIFSDGQKSNATKDVSNNIDRVRKLIKNEKRFLKVIIIISETNKGLQESIIYGISYVLSNNKNIIVLEDDLIVSPYFLKYMNDGLNKYEYKTNVGSICAYWHPSIKTFPDELFFFLNGGDCWGWATWIDRWSLFESDALLIKNKLIENNLIDKFDFGGMIEILDLQIKNKVSSWFIRWHGSLILNNKLSLFPSISFVRNIGLDGSGTHGDNMIIYISKLNKYKKDLSGIEIDIPSINSHELYIKNQFKLLKRIKPKKNIFKRILNKIKKYAFNSIKLIKIYLW
jgi:hypothetical protein